MCFLCNYRMVELNCFFFRRQRWKSSCDHQYDDTRPRWKTWAGDSVRLLLTKNPAWSYNCPWYQVHGTWFKRFPRPWQTFGPILGPSWCADSSLAFFKEVGSSFGVIPSLVCLQGPVWWADTSRKGTSTVRVWCNPRVPLSLASHLGPTGMSGSTA